MWTLPRSALGIKQKSSKDLRELQFTADIARGPYTRNVQRSHEVRNGRFGLRLKYTF